MILVAHAASHLTDMQQVSYVRKFMGVSRTTVSKPWSLRRTIFSRGYCFWQRCLHCYMFRLTSKLLVITYHLPLPRSQGTSKRSWWNPEGGNSKFCRLANVFVMRMLYVTLGSITKGRDCIYFSGSTFWCTRVICMWCLALFQKVGTTMDHIYTSAGVRSDAQGLCFG